MDTGGQLAFEAASEEQMHVDFEFFDPKEEDEPHLLALIAQGALAKAAGKALHPRALATFLAAQPAVGTLVKADDNLFAFLSTLSLIHQRGLPLVRDLTNYLLERAKPTSVRDTIRRMLEPTQPAVGLVISERVFNAPLQLIPDAYSSLLQDIEWAIENEEEAILRESFRFARLLFLAEVTVSNSAEITSKENGNGPATKKKRKGATKGDGVDLDALSFARVEEEIFAHVATEHALVGGADGVSLLVYSLSIDELRASVSTLPAVMSD